MAPPSKTADARRKSGGKASLIVTLNVPPAQLQEIFGASPESVKEESPSQDVKESKESPATPAAIEASANSNGENGSDSNAPTPAAEGTPAPSVMGPPTEGSKKKGVKRSAATANGSSDANKPRGKPGPKKKPRLEDGTIDHTTAANRPSGAHKLGPRANQGAINAGLRALDKSGKPCRKWAKGDFKLKSFTGVVWEIPRWTAPPKKLAEDGTEDSAAPSADDSSKENKENGVDAPNSVSNSNSRADADLQSVPSVNASSPAPMAIAAAS